METTISFFTHTWSVGVQHERPYMTKDYTKFTGTRAEVNAHAEKLHAETGRYVSVEDGTFCVLLLQNGKRTIDRG
jgi:hypothetical protein